MRLVAQDQASRTRQTEALEARLEGAVGTSMACAVKTAMKGGGARACCDSCGGEPERHLLPGMPDVSRGARDMPWLDPGMRVRRAACGRVVVGGLPV